MYRHTQVSWSLAVTLGGLLTMDALVILQGKPLSGLVLAQLIGITLAFVLFGLPFLTLTVTVDEHAVEARFGGGVISKRLELATISSAQAVKNSWLVGHGIRWVGNGWLWSVAGHGAVELALKTGQRFRIGTNQPRQLCTAIQDRLADRSRS
jgi:hypothetical protein